MMICFLNGEESLIVWMAFLVLFFVSCRPPRLVGSGEVDGLLTTTTYYYYYYSVPFSVSFCCCLLLPTVAGYFLF
jgi:hypothetical protein